MDELSARVAHDDAEKVMRSLLAMSRTLGEVLSAIAGDARKAAPDADRVGDWPEPWQGVFKAVWSIGAPLPQASSAIIAISERIALESPGLTSELIDELRDAVGRGDDK